MSVLGRVLSVSGAPSAQPVFTVVATAYVPKGKSQAYAGLAVLADASVSPDATTTMAPVTETVANKVRCLNRFIFHELTCPNSTAFLFLGKIQ